jgi:hypothetical protein
MCSWKGYQLAPIRVCSADFQEPLLPVGRASTVQRSSYTDLAGAGCSLANSESRHHEIQERKLRGEASRKECLVE